MVDTAVVKGNLALAEKLVSAYMFPEADATEFALRSLTNEDANDVLRELCNDDVSLEKLSEFMPHARILKLVESAELWINVSSRGQEMHVITTYSGQLTAAELHARYRSLADAFEHYGLIRIVSAIVGGYTKYTLTLIEGKS